MLIYLSLLIFVLTLAFISRLLPQYRNVICLMIVFGCTFIAGFRYDVGMDYESYNDGYNSIKYGSGFDTEIGFVALCKACIAVGGTSQLMFLILAVLTMALLYSAYKRYSSDLVLTLALFLCFGQMYMNTFNAIRQCFAIGIFCYSVKYIQRRELVKYLTAITLAALFHTTAVLLYPLYWILTKKWNRLFLLAVLIGVVFSSGLILTIINHSPYAMYITHESFTHEASATNYIYLICGFVIYAFSHRIMKHYPDRTILLNINFLALLLFVLYLVFSGTPLVMVISRLTYYFIFFYAVIFARIITDIKGPVMNLLIRMGVYGFLIFMYLRTTMLLGEQYHLLPFRFNFNLF